MNTLQQLQQSNPTNYQQVTQQIATNLQAAAQTAQSEGNTTAANQLNQLATDFTNASTSGQLPNIQDLAQAMGGHHHHHHHHHRTSGSEQHEQFEQHAGSTSGGLPDRCDPERLARSGFDHSEHAVQLRNWRLNS